jgi:quercetin dioxygenase-like cupin family protein
MKHAISLTVAVAMCALSTASAQHQGGHTMVVPSELQWGPVSSLPPGAQIAVIEGPMTKAGPITARIRFPANYRLPAHTHPVIEHVTVISGTIHMGAGDRLDTAKTKALPAGGFAIMQPGTPHFLWTEEETIVQVHSVGPWGIDYVNPRDDPRKQ